MESFFNIHVIDYGFSLITSSILLYGISENSCLISSAQSNAMAILVSDNKDIFPEVSNRLMEP